MPRDLPLSNGSLLINFDSFYRLRDFYFPHVGKENHSAGHPFRFGVWVNGVFRWIDDSGWRRRMVYEKDTLVTRVALSHPDLPVSIVSSDVVDFHENLYLRQLSVTNESTQPLEVRFFFHHDFHIYENDVGDTAYYEPQRKVVFHYKDQRWFLINGSRGADDYGVDQFATGQKERPGFEGTWRDAEDGALSGNPIAQGSVDSTVALHLALPPSGFGELFYWIAVGEDFTAVTDINRRVLERGAASFLDRTGHYWRLWVNHGQHDFGDIPHAVSSLYLRSLLILRTQIDVDGGILAANDWDITQFSRDTYSYIWPRDGALVTLALIMAGYSVTARSFLTFCQRLLTREGYFLHKYNPDGSLASSWHPWFAHGRRELPIQADETGLVLWALWSYFEHFGEVEFIKPMFRDLIVRAGSFLAAYRDSKTGLPQPSWDLWEERRGILSWTVGCVYAGLVGASKFAEAFGEVDLRDQFQQAAEEIKAGTDKYLWQESAGRFVRMIVPRDDGGFDVDWTIDSSVVGLFQSEMYSANDPRIVKTMESIRERLWVKTSVGGMARYENDYYQQVSHDLTEIPGNPWFVCTLWLARWYIARANSTDDLAPAMDILNWVAERALPSGVLAEQVNPYDGSPLSVSPLTWSHGELVRTVAEYLDKVSHLDKCPTCGSPLFLRERSRVGVLRQIDHASR
ncbi:MAG TPA: glycoside hydrolase family 15 protein [Chloroflexota bacterium]|nr:glycoside hydrolase family 15 protein [Chloroflexota bacterium]